MNTLNNVSSTMPTSIEHTLQNKLKKADIDHSGTISKDEVMVSAPKGTSQEKIDQMFARLDSDENGEISVEEQKAMIEQLEERMSNRPMSNKTALNQDSFNAFGSFLKTMEQATASKNGVAGTNDQALATSLKDFTQKYPKIDTQA